MWFRIVLLFVVSALVLAFPAQGQQSDVKMGRVYVSGENPVIRLAPKEGEDDHTVASFWRIIWSPVGMGHVLYINSDITGDGPTSDDVRAAFTDNEALPDYMVREVLGTFNKSYIDNPYPKRMARFEQAGLTWLPVAGSNGQQTLVEWKEMATSDQHTIELVWRDFYPAFQLDIPVGGERLPFGITSLFIPAKSADVIINGKKAVGRPFPQMRGPTQSSSAFLAFSESWIK